MLGDVGSPSSSYSADDAGVLVQLAGIAAGDISGGVVLQGWSPLATVPATPPSPANAGGAQAFFVRGNLPSAGTTVVVLALGMPWQTYLNNFSDGLLDLQPMPLGLPSSIGNVVLPFGVLYSQLRAGIWTSLGLAGRNPIVVTGIGLGGPLAQLAAFDLNPTNTGPAKQKGPPAQPSCYAFSSPPPGDAGFAASFATNVAAGWTVTPTFLGAPIDEFGVLPSDGSVAAAGVPQEIAAQFPAPFDDPWIERSPWFYAQALGQTVAPPPVVPASVSPPGTGFQPVLAGALAQLCAVTYGLAQNPTLAIQKIPASYTYLGTIPSSGSAAIAALFSFPGGCAVAFRGGITFNEFGGIVANSNQTNAAFLSATAYVHAGALQVYTTIQAALLAQLKTLPAQTPLVFAGHDLGGALAVLAAADVVTNATALAAPSVYTFGAVPAGSNFAAALFNPAPTVFAVMRPADFMAQSMTLAGFDAVGTAITLAGTPAQDEPGAHSITGYAALLDPWSS